MKALGRKAFSDRYETGKYLEKVPDWHVEDSRWKAAKVYDMLARHSLAPDTICDVGCGAGEVLAELARKMGSVTRFIGYDISPQAIEICKPKANGRLEFHSGDFLTDSREPYGAILLLDVFEHVQDYLGFLRELSNRANWFVFHIPLDINAGTVLFRSKYMMQMRAKYGHLHYFTAETAFATLEDTGYSIIDSFYTWDGELAGYPKMPRNPVAIIKQIGQNSILAVERLTNGRAPALWARVRQHYNLLVLAKRQSSSGNP